MTSARQYEAEYLLAKDSYESCVASKGAQGAIYCIVHRNAMLSAMDALVAARGRGDADMVGITVDTGMLTPVQTPPSTPPIQITTGFGPGSQIPPGRLSPPVPAASSSKLLMYLGLAALVGGGVYFATRRKSSGLSGGYGYDFDGLFDAPKRKRKANNRRGKRKSRK